MGAESKRTDAENGGRLKPPSFYVITMVGKPPDGVFLGKVLRHLFKMTDANREAALNDIGRFGATRITGYTFEVAGEKVAALNDAAKKRGSSLRATMDPL